MIEAARRLELLAERVCQRGGSKYAVAHVPPLYAVADLATQQDGAVTTDEPDHDDEGGDGAADQPADEYGDSDYGNVDHHLQEGDATLGAYTGQPAAR
jgi:hypothetical protein